MANKLTRRYSDSVSSSFIPERIINIDAVIYMRQNIHSFNKDIYPRDKRIGMLITAPTLAEIIIPAWHLFRKLTYLTTTIILLVTISLAYLLYHQAYLAMANFDPYIAIDSVHEARVKHMQENCTQYAKGRVNDLYLHHNYNLAYCPVDGIGKTFWKRVYLFFNYGDGIDKVKNMFYIPRYFNFFSPNISTHTTGQDLTSDEMFQNYTRFMFVRDPYDRLWSHYLNKFYLPMLWDSHAMAIVDRRDNDMGREPSLCDGSGVQFSEFLEYATSASYNNMLYAPWVPITGRCDPCLFQPDIIGKHERFAEDAKYILDKVGAGWVMEKYKENDQINEEIRLLTEDSFAVIKSRGMDSCGNKIQLAVRLWNVFQMKGYMHLNETAENFVEFLSNTYAEMFDGNVLTYHALMERKKYPEEERLNWMLYKEETLRVAYRDVSQPLLDRIRQVYKTDFEMFGYDQTSPWERNSSDPGFLINFLTRLFQ